MAVTEIKEALRSAANTASKYVRDAATLDVKTRTVETGTGDEPLLAAHTVIKLDGDNETVVPATKNEDGKLEVDTVFYDLHMQNVRSAIDYRSRMVDSLLSVLRST